LSGHDAPVDPEEAACGGRTRPDRGTGYAGGVRSPNAARRFAEEPGVVPVLWPSVFEAELQRDRRQALELSELVVSAAKEGVGMSERTRLVDLTVIELRRTDKAIKVSLEDDERKTAWLPLSQVEIEELDGDRLVVTMKEALAIEKELV
jgi:hypothetical protein